MASHARIKFPVPKPPTRQNTRNDPDATLAWINKRVRELISTYSDQPAREEATLDPKTYLVIYTTISDYADAKRTDLVGETLYHDLVKAVRAHCKDLRQEILRGTSETISGDTDILERLVEERKRFGALAKIIAHLYRYLDRHWVRQQLDQGKGNVYRILDVQEKIFKHDVIIGALRAEQGSEEDQVSILDVATRARENDALASKDISNHRQPGLIDESLAFSIISDSGSSARGSLLHPLA